MSIAPEIIKQKQIVDVIRQRSELEFFHLVYLCWSVTGRFGFDGIKAEQWNDVLYRLRKWEKPPRQFELEQMMCVCFRMHHSKSCPVRGFCEAMLV